MKKFLVVLSVLVGLIVLAGIALVLLVDVNSYKPRIESAASEALGMEFRIRGKAGLHILPPVGVSFSDILLRNRGSDLATVGTVRVGVALLPLLHRQLVITDLVLDDPNIRIEKEKDGKFNFETAARPKKAPETKEKSAGPGASVSLENAFLKNGAFLYLDRATGSRTSLSGVEVHLKDLNLPSSPDVPLQKRIRFTGELRIKELKTAELTVHDVKADVTASGGICDVRPLTMTLFGGKGEGGIRADLSKKEPAVKIDYVLKDFRAEDSLAAVTKEKRLSGPLTLSSVLSFRGDTAAGVKRTLSGIVSLRGKGLAVHGIDIDGVLSSASAARRMDPADIGAFLLAGPLGTAATKGFRFGEALESAGRGGNTEVTNLVSDWTIRDGIADAQDVAFATRKSRFALKGRLDLVNERYRDVTVAVLDPKGCTKIRQRIDGPFRNPKLDKASTLESTVVGSVLDLLGPAKKVIEGTSECKIFYSGSVAPPR